MRSGINATIKRSEDHVRRHYKQDDACVHTEERKRWYSGPDEPALPLDIDLARLNAKLWAAAVDPMAHYPMFFRNARATFRIDRDLANSVAYFNTLQKVAPNDAKFGRYYLVFNRRGDLTRGRLIGYQPENKICRVFLVDEEEFLSIPVDDIREIPAEYIKNWGHIRSASPSL
uniref:DUF3825 domain-containing protein n=1 Tax=Panagrellus redivivus TaxID=6233 RepID=A0A7E4UYR9_PANRE